MLTINPCRIVATILAKNEEDIIAQMIEHHLNNGVSQIIFTDNNSTDNTRKIAEKYPEIVEIIDEADDTHNQSKWVTRMARIACKLNPDWIIHLDADEFWGGLNHLRRISDIAVSCEVMYLHPPITNAFDINSMRFFLDFDHLPIPQEAKVAHRPDPNIEIAHGNHAVIGKSYSKTKLVYRHHFPIRSLEQWKRKSSGHLSLSKRNAICKRWEKWYNSISYLDEQFKEMNNLWQEFIKTKEKKLFLSLMKFWATEEMIHQFENSDMLPNVGEWPKEKL